MDWMGSRHLGQPQSYWVFEVDQLGRLYRLEIHRSSLGLLEPNQYYRWYWVGQVLADQTTQTTTRFLFLNWQSHQRPYQQVEMSDLTVLVL
jgi:hypothetical protein